MAAVLFLLPAVIALVLVILHHHLDEAAVAVLVTAAVGLPVAWLTWAIFRDARRSAVPVSELTTVQAANQLARAVGAQWNAEAAVRRLNDPWPLPVSWDRGGRIPDRLLGLAGEAGDAAAPDGLQPPPAGTLGGWSG